MADISLRGYVREIDELIEREKLDEAIAHCRHILQTYPKHLETYRLLGKAYLEAKRYGDAADIFQRVLSAVPDDFVSHIGMAIVREDEGNLDASIWHMERAFETNPANPAIQQELRRLIGRRDGLEPHKVRLTRGALARMYAHGELYQQAITELRSALQEDPERPDLQVLLADMYWRTGQQNEAVAVSNRVLEKLPNCLEANRVLAASLRGKERIEESAVYHRRLAGLDPYASFVESTETDTQTVEAAAVTLARLEWRPGQPIPSARAEQPGWAATLGMELQERQAEESAGGAPRPGTGPLPSWLEPGEPPPFLGVEDTGQPLEPDLPIEAPMREDFATGMETEEPSAMEAAAAHPQAASRPGSEEIPSWMREAGWGESTGEAVDQPVSFSDEELGALAAGQLPTPPAAAAPGELTPAQLPDWIHDIAPSAEELATQAAESDIGETAAQEAPAWLQQAQSEAEEPFSAERFAGPAPAAAEPSGPEGRLGFSLGAQEEEAPSPQAEMLSGLEEMAPGGVEPAEGGAPPAELDSREWPTWIADEPPGATDTIVTWLDSQGKRPPQPEREEVPEWMSEIDLPAEEPAPAAEAMAAEPPEVQRPSAEAVDRPPVQPPMQPPEAAGAPGWLAAVAEAAAREERSGDVGAGERPYEERPAPAEPSKELVMEEPPDWITELAQTEEQIAGEEAAVQLPGEPPSWLRAEVPGEMEPEPAVELGRSQPAKLELEQPAEFETDQMAEPEATTAEEQTPVSEITLRSQGRADVPEWLEGLAESVRGAEATTVSEWTEEPQEPVGADAAMPSTETPDWLRGLAEEGPPTAPAGRPVEAPDWLRSLGEPGVESAEEIEAPGPAGEVPEWLQSTGADSQAAEVTSAPDWLSGLAEERPAEVEGEAALPEAESAVGGGWQTPDWLEAAQAEIEDEPAAEFIPEFAAEAEPVGEATPTEAVDDDHVMDWLEDLAARQSEAGSEEPEEETKWLEISFGESAAEPLMEQRHMPEEPDEGLEWLERLAEQRGLDIDIGAQQPSASVTEEPPVEPERRAPAAVEPEAVEPSEVPEWMQRMASAPTIPIPKFEQDALDALSVDTPGPADETLKRSVAREAEPASAEPSSWEPPPTAVPPIAEQPPPEPLAEPEEEVPEWLSSFAADWTPPPRPAAETGWTPPAPEQPPVPAPIQPPAFEPPPAPAPVQPPVAEPPPAPAPAPVQPPAAEPRPAPTPRPTAAQRVRNDEELLDESRQALAAGEIDRAASSYAILIKAGRSVEAVIEDLQIALDRSPENAGLWQCLGDAYMKDGQVSEAIDAYRRGMEAA